MAIAKMNKVMLIAPTEKQNDLLDAIQELQSLEVTLLEQAKELFTQKSIVLKDADEQEVNTLQKQFEGINAAIQSGIRMSSFNMLKIFVLLYAKKRMN